jgi:hypothetical protein
VELPPRERSSLQVQKGQRNTKRSPESPGGGTSINNKASGAVGGKIFRNCGEILGLNIKVHGKISESATSGMNRGTPYAAGSAIEAHDQKKIPNET